MAKKKTKEEQGLCTCDTVLHSERDGSKTEVAAQSEQPAKPFHIRHDAVLLSERIGFVHDMIPAPYGFVSSDIKRVEFGEGGRLDVTFVSLIPGIGEGFVVPAEIVRKKILPVIGITGLLLKDYLAMTLGSYEAIMEELVQESLKRNLQYFIFYIPKSSIECVDVLAMFDKDFNVSGEVYTDTEANYMLYSPYGHIAAMCAANDDEKLYKPSDIALVDIAQHKDKFGMTFALELTEEDITDKFSILYELKSPVSSPMPNSLSAAVTVPDFRFGFMLPQNFLKGKYENRSLLEVHETLCKYRDLVGSAETDWRVPFQSLLDWDKCTGKIAAFMSDVYMAMECAFPEPGEDATDDEKRNARWTTDRLVKGIGSGLANVKKQSASLIDSINKCLGYMLVWSVYGCRTCEKLPKDV